MHSWQGRGGVFDNNKNGNNELRDNDNNSARTTLTSFFGTTTSLWSDAFLAGKGG